jgi:hypothetical protein
VPKAGPGLLAGSAAGAARTTAVAVRALPLGLRDTRGKREDTALPLTRPNRDVDGQSPVAPEQLTRNWHLPRAAATVPSAAPVIHSVSFCPGTRAGSDGMADGTTGIVLGGGNAGTETTPLPHADLANAFSFSEQFGGRAAGWAHRRRRHVWVAP